jgi:hypothetical protein
MEEPANSTDRRTNESKPGSRRYAPVAAALFGVVAALLIGGYFLSTRLRPPLEAGSAIAPAASATSASLLQASGGAAAASVSAPASALASASGEVRAQAVEVAYLHYWDVYSQAMLTLDTSHLGEVAAGDRLQQAIAEVQDLKAQGKAAHIEIQHHIGVFDVTSTSASVHDDYTNNSYTIDPVSKQPVGSPGKSEHLVDTYFLQPIDGVWKVVRGVRESG